MADSNYPKDEVVGIILKHKNIPGPLLPILHAVQNQLGYIPEDAVSDIALELNLSRAEVHGVISFYHHFSHKPRGKHIIEICRAESCQALGGRELESHAKSSLKLNWHETTADGEITLEPVYCLGNCACSPSIRVGKNIMGRVTKASLDEIIEELGTVAVEIR